MRTDQTGIKNERALIRAYRALGYRAKSSHREDMRFKNDVILTHASCLPFPVAVQTTLQLDHWRKMEAFLASREHNRYQLSIYLETTEETESAACAEETIEAVLDFRMKRHEIHSFGLRVAQGEPPTKPFNIEKRAALLKAEMDPKITGDRRLWGGVVYAERTFILIRGSDERVYISYPGNTEEALDKRIRQKPQDVHGSSVTFIPAGWSAGKDKKPVARAVLWQKNLMNKLSLHHLRFDIDEDS